MGADSAEPAVPLPVVDRLLGTVAAALHDRPVQSLVAGKLLLETVLVAHGVADDLADRGLAAIDTAGRQSRDLMWALHPPGVRADQLEADLRDLVARAAAPDEEVEVTVRLDRSPAAAILDPLAAAVHAVLVEVLLAGGHARRVTLSCDGAALQAIVAGDLPADRDDGPWLTLAGIRLAPVGGRVGVTRHSGLAVADLTVPVPA